MNIFTYKDSNDKGIDWRMMEQWPKEIKNNEILNLVRPHDETSD